MFGCIVPSAQMAEPVLFLFIIFIAIHISINTINKYFALSWFFILKNLSVLVTLELHWCLI